MTDGTYAALLGAVVPLHHTVFDAPALWLEVAVDGVALGPRTPLTELAAPTVAAGTLLAGTVRADTLVLGNSACSETGVLAWDAANQSLRVCNGTGWLPIATGRTIALDNGARRWSDGGVARSCYAYRYPTGEGDRYMGDVGSGLYAIDPDGPTGDPSFNVYCDMVSHGGGWTLVLSAGLARDLSGGNLTGDVSPYPSSAAQPANGVLYKISDARINLIKTTTGSAIGYWVTTPGSGTGLLGAELFHRADCAFQMHRPLASIMATTCHQSTTAFSATPTWVSGGRWWDNDGGGGYYWAFGQQQRGDHGTGGTCASDGRGLGVHNPTYHPFHRGWCGTQAWGQVWVR